MNEDKDVIDTFWNDIAFSIDGYIDNDVKPGEVTTEMILDVIGIVADDVAPITLGYNDVTVEDMQNTMGIPDISGDEVDTFMRMTEEDRAQELYDVFKENAEYITNKYNQHLKDWEDKMKSLFSKKL